MFSSLNQLGSMVLDIEGDRLEAKFLRENGQIDDYFTLRKGDWLGSPKPALEIVRSAGGVAIKWPTSQPRYGLERTHAVDPPGAWGPVTEPPAVTGRQNWVQLPPNDPSQFFRLRRLP